MILKPVGEGLQVSEAYYSSAIRALVLGVLLVRLVYFRVMVAMQQVIYLVLYRWLLIKIVVSQGGGGIYFRISCVFVPSLRLFYVKICYYSKSVFRS